MGNYIVNSGRAGQSGPAQTRPNGNDIVAQAMYALQGSGNSYDVYGGGPLAYDNFFSFDTRKVSLAQSPLSQPAAVAATAVAHGDVSGMGGLGLAPAAPAIAQNVGDPIWLNPKDPWDGALYTPIDAPGLIEITGDPSKSRSFILSGELANVSGLLGNVEAAINYRYNPYIRAQFDQAGLTDHDRHNQLDSLGKHEYRFVIVPGDSLEDAKAKFLSGMGIGEQLYLNDAAYSTNVDYAFEQYFANNPSELGYIDITGIFEYTVTQALDSVDGYIRALPDVAGELERYPARYRDALQFEPNAVTPADREASLVFNKSMKYLVYEDQSGLLPDVFRQTEKIHDTYVTRDIAGEFLSILSAVRMGGRNSSSAAEEVNLSGTRMSNLPLRARLEYYKAWKAEAGISGRATYSQYRSYRSQYGWVNNTQSGYVNWSSGVDLNSAPAGTEVTWNNGWRTADGKFASPLGGDRAGSGAETTVWNSVEAKPGWGVIRGQVAVRDASGQLRYYDGAAISPRGRVIGLEVKSGTATQTAAQKTFDTTLNSSTSNVAIGVGKSSGTVVQRTIVIRVP